jgi:hypothetical protein
MNPSPLNFSATQCTPVKVRTALYSGCQRAGRVIRRVDRAAAAGSGLVKLGVDAGASDWLYGCPVATLATYVQLDYAKMLR